MKIEEGSRFRLTRNWRGSGVLLYDGVADEEFRCVVPVDSVLVSIRDVDLSATGFLCVPESQQVIDEIVPEEDRRKTGFTGCRFMFFTGDVGSLLEAI